MAAYAIITFHTTHFALKAKKVLNKNGKNPEMIPVPREFSSNCGFCCKVPWAQVDEIKRIFINQHVDFDQVYHWQRDDKEQRKKKFNFV